MPREKDSSSDNDDERELRSNFETCWIHNVKAISKSIEVRYIRKGLGIEIGTIFRAVNPERINLLRRDLLLDVHVANVNMLGAGTSLNSMS